MGVAMNRKPQMPLAVFETKPGVIKMTTMTITESADFNWHGYYKVNIDLFFSNGATASTATGPPHYGGFTITIS